MAIPYRTAKFKSANILVIVILAQVPVTKSTLSAPDLPTLLSISSMLTIFTHSGHKIMYWIDDLYLLRTT